MKTKEPDNAVKVRLKKLRVRSKLGLEISRADMIWLQKIYREYPTYYISLNKDVFEETKPFGSH